MSDLNDPKLQSSIRLLEKLLMAAGPNGKTASECIAAASRSGLTAYDLKKARRVVKATSEKQKGVSHGPWIWRLPPGYKPVELPRIHFEPSPRAVPVHSRTAGDAYRPQYSGVVDGNARILGVRRVPYQSYCPECDTPSRTLMRLIEIRETSDGEHYSVDAPGGASDIRSVRCDPCKQRQIAVKRAEIARRIDGLINEANRIFAADPNDPNGLSIAAHIERIQRDLTDWEKGIENE